MFISRGWLEAQFRLNPVRLAMDKVPFPNAAKDMIRLSGRDAGVPYRPCLPTAEGAALDYMRNVMCEAGCSDLSSAEGGFMLSLDTVKGLERRYLQ